MTGQIEASDLILMTPLTHFPKFLTWIILILDEAGH
jgi:hypothetical protein